MAEGLLRATTPEPAEFVRGGQPLYNEPMESPTSPAGSRDEREVSSPTPAGGGRPRSLANLTVAEIQMMAQDAGRAAFEVALDTKVGASMIVGGKVVRVVRAGREPDSDT